MESRNRIPGILCVAALAGYLLFILPYSFPPQVRLVSPSYAFGFSNRVAILAFVLFVLALGGIQVSLQRGTGLRAPAYRAIGETGRPDRALVFFFLGACIWYLILTASIYFALAKSSGYYKLDFEASHFLWHVHVMTIYGLRPYRDFVFEYGPILAYGPTWFYDAVRPFGLTPDGAYYVFHYILNVLGLLALLQLVNSLVMPMPRWKLLVFTLIAIPAFSPAMGLNGVLIRYLLPYWSLLLVHRAAERARRNESRYGLAAIVMVMSLMSIGISPDVGIASLVTMSAYAVLLFRIDRVAALWILGSEAGAALLSAVVIPVEYFHTLLSFSQGGNNYPLVPAVHILFYVTLVLLCVPRLVASGYSQPGSAGSYAFAQGILILALAPAALSRCDPPHIILTGFGLFIIAFGMFAQQGQRRLAAYTLAYVLVAIVFFQWSNARSYGLSAAKLAAGTNRILAALHLPSSLEIHTAPARNESTSPPAIPSLAGLRRKPFALASFDTFPALGLPYGSYGYDRELQNYLWRKKKVVPQRYVGALAVYTEAQMNEALTDLSHLQYIVIQQYFTSLAHPTGDACEGQSENFKWSQIYPFAPHCVHTAIEPNTEIALFIERHFRPVEQIGDYVIFERNQ